MNKQPIDLLLIGGFLGAGKTTFLKRLLAESAGRKLGVLVNEFGAVSIDGMLLRRDGIEMVELSHGSIFCSCLKQDFVTALVEFSKLDIEALIVENSGMADPGGMSLILDQLQSSLQRPYRYRGVLCLADALTLPDYLDVLLPLQRQLEAADFVLLNKTDLVSAAAVEEVHGMIRQYNETVEICNTVYGEIPLDYLISRMQYHGYCVEPGVCPCNTVEKRPANYTLEADGAYTIERVRAFCQAMSPMVVRLKGFVKSTDGGWIQADVVGPQVVVEPLTGEEPDLECSKLVAIGADRRKFGDEMERLWEHHCVDLCTIREA